MYHKHTAGLLLQTGQMTQHFGMPDDGLLRKGLPMSYQVLDTLDQSGNKNIDLPHYQGIAGHVYISASGILQQMTLVLDDTLIIAGNTINVQPYITIGPVGGPIIYVVLEGDTPATVAAAIRLLMIADGAIGDPITGFFSISGDGPNIILTAVTAAMNDTAWGTIAWTENVGSNFSTVTIMGAAPNSINSPDYGLEYFRTGDVVVLAGTVNDPGPFTVIASEVDDNGGHNGFTVSSGTIIDETPAGSVTISKREALTNSCVVDNVTGLIWSRAIPRKFGAYSDGALAAYDAIAIYSIYNFCQACNAALLGGFGDWRIPNARELLSIMLFSESNAYPNPDVFGDLSWVPETPSGSGGAPFYSSTHMNANYLSIDFQQGVMADYGNSESFAMLVRG